MVKKVICVIPARLASTRFPKKILARIGSKTMLEHVYTAAKKCPQFSEVIIALDSEETATEVDRFGGKYCMTSVHHINGTSRLIEVMNRYELLPLAHLGSLGPSEPSYLLNSGKVLAALDSQENPSPFQERVLQADVWVNWQADEPFITPVMIDDLLQGIEKEGLIWTLKKEIHNEEEMKNPSVVKVVTDLQQRALYFSRSLIPYNRTGALCPIYKHIGLYAYASEALKKIASLPPSPFAEAESLEQLAFLQHSLPIHVYPTQYETIGIDTPEDLTLALTQAELLS